ncbi:hypothetical protein BDY24DRAFT_107520 [Mrakia frigida]|uniref:uncharacterized protein n=1 Tax=Mrakia frigida TaxID=29902 RepID=UPI003FCBEF90
MLLPSPSDPSRRPLYVLLSLLSAGIFLSLFAFSTSSFNSSSSNTRTWDHSASEEKQEGDLMVGGGLKGSTRRCERTMLYLASGPHGFASEFIILLRAAWFANEHGYELLVDSDEGWTYGSMLEYLLPHRTTCVPDGEWRTRERTTVGEQGWENESNVFTSRYHGRDFIEDSFRLLLSPTHLPAFPTDPPASPSSGKIETLPVLPPSMALPEAYRAAYQALSPLAREYWTPSPTVEMQVQMLKEEWRVEERRSVGCHVRMGDKAWELQGDEEKAGGKIAFRQGDFKAYITAAQLMLPLLPPPTSTTILHTPPLPPLLILMSDSPSILSSFLSLPHEPFEIVQLPVLSPSAKGHSEQEFTALPRRDRVQLTEGFVRDMTMLGREVGAFIGTGSSNVGDMISLLVGEERAVEKGLVRSLDSPFYWTSWFEVWK